LLAAANPLAACSAMLLPIAHAHAAVCEAFDQAFLSFIVFFLSKGKTVKAERERESEWY
jgi:hypothetical protein